MMSVYQASVYQAAANAGLFVGTWSPGDGVTRYRFFQEGEWSNGVPVQDFNIGDGIKTVAGRRDALLWLSGYTNGRKMASTREHYILCTRCQDHILVIGPDKDVDKALWRVDWTTGPVLCRKCNRRNNG